MKSVVIDGHPLDNLVRNLRGGLAAVFPAALVWVLDASLGGGVVATVAASQRAKRAPTDTRAPTALAVGLVLAATYAGAQRAWDAHRFLAGRSVYIHDAKVLLARAL